MVRASEAVATTSNKIEAAGTSEGAKKGWEGRMNDHTAGSELEKNIDHHLKKGWMEKDDGDHIGLSAVAQMLHRGHKEMAMKMTRHMDTAAREVIPAHVWHHMGGELTPRGEAEAKKSLKGLGALHEPSAKATDTEEKEETVKANEPKAAIHCKSSGTPLKAKKVWAVDEPIDFMWMPGGVHTIHASYGRAAADQRPIELTVMCDKGGAESVQASFEAIRAASPRRPPFICVEHRAEERAGEPQSFEWRDVPEPAIYCRCLPSGLGANNVNAKIHTSFSPTFDTDAEYHKMQCTDCEKQPVACKCSGGGWYFPPGVKGSASNPAKVTAPDVQSVGSLTNWNAFREMLPIAARENGGGKVEAAGTSEGVKKAWETRHSSYSDIANELSEKANAHPSAGFTSEHGHYAGMRMHQQAADAHRAAEEEQEEKVHKDFHKSSAKLHDARAAAHQSVFNGMSAARTAAQKKTKATSTETTTETVKATETETEVETTTTAPLTADTILAAHAPLESADVVMARLSKKGLGLGFALPKTENRTGTVPVTVEAAGTSEGVKKSWEKRHSMNQNEADEASHDAHDWSAKAGRYANNQTIHLAAQAHDKASMSHFRAKRTAHEGGDTEGVEHHEKQAREHEALANDLIKRIPKSYFRNRAESTESTTETVKADEPLTADTILARMGQSGRPPAHN